MASADLHSPSLVAHELARFDPEVPLARAWTPPASWYTWSAFHMLERTAVFGRSWQLVARVDQLTAPGAFVAVEHAGYPWVVVRGDDGVLRAFHNTCRHKATPVATGAGRCDELVCPYHGWRYRLDGRLKSAPRIAGIKDFDRDRLRLPPIRVETWGPFVFVNGDADAAPLTDSLTELDARLAATDWSRLTFHSRKTYDFACNWKVFNDNYLDGGYHIAHMHPTLDAQLDMSSYRTELFETYSVQSSDAAASRDPRITVDASERIGDHGALYAWLYPNLMLNRYGPVLDTNLVLPLGPDRCRVLFDFWFDPEAPDAARFIADSMAQSHVTQLEDIAVSESVQRGLAAGSYDRGPYAPRVEQGIHHFHRLLAADLSVAVAATP